MQAGRDFDAILFDLGGVLVELTGVERMLGWCPHVDDTATLWHRWLHSEAVRRFETGISTADAFAADVVREFALSVAPEQFLAEFTYWPRALFPGATELLAALAPDYLLASVSNTNSLHWDRFTTEWSLHTLFHHNFPSHQVGRLKPDAAYFDHVVTTLDLPPERILFVDDNRINVESAARLGLAAREVPGFAALVAALQEFEIVPGTALPADP